MPGRTSSEAVSSFLAPLKEAFKVLDGPANLSVSPKGGYRKAVRYAWVLNGADGMPLGRAGTFFAGMTFEIIDTDPDTNEFRHPLRVSTRSYNYKLRSPDGTDHWRIHWHPEGNSQITWPHLHMPPSYVHLRVDRTPLEQAILWCTQYDAPMTCDIDEADQRLALTAVEHKLYKSW